MNSTTILDEKELVKKAKESPEAFGELYEIYFPKIYNFICFRVRHYDLADELTSQVFERALQKIDQYDESKGSFNSWIYRIAHNAIVDHVRHQNRHKVVAFEAALPTYVTTKDPEYEYMSEETSDEILKALDHLNQRERDIVALKFWSEMTNRSIAKELGLSESNIGVILYRAMKKLHKALKGS